jgi:hypothetical protein
VWKSDTLVVKTVWWGKRTDERAYVQIDGARVVGSCCNCARENCVDLLEFRPKECVVNNTRLPTFVENLRMLKSELAVQAPNRRRVRECMRAVVDTRHAKCQICQARKKLSPAEQACKDFYEKTRRRMCAQQDGCAKPGCCERGPNAVHVIQGDHLERLPGTRAMSDFTKWPRRGGVPAMKTEMGWEEVDGVLYTRKMQWICGFCHALEPTSNQANRYTEADTKEENKGKWNGTEAERKQYERHRTAVVIYPKQRFNDDAKLAVGACADCGRRVTRCNVWAFHWDHRDARTKLRTSRLLLGKGAKQSGVAGIVQNKRKASAIHKRVRRRGESLTVREWIRREQRKCDLVCTNCHHRRTHAHPRFGAP